MTTAPWVTNATASASEPPSGPDGCAEGPGCPWSLNAGRFGVRRGKGDKHSWANKDGGLSVECCRVPVCWRSWRSHTRGAEGPVLVGGAAFGIWSGAANLASSPWIRSAANVSPAGTCATHLVLTATHGCLPPHPDRRLARAPWAAQNPDRSFAAAGVSHVQPQQTHPLLVVDDVRELAARLAALFALAAALALGWRWRAVLVPRVEQLRGYWGPASADAVVLWRRGTRRQRGAVGVTAL